MHSENFSYLSPHRRHPKEGAGAGNLFKAAQETMRCRQVKNCLLYGTVVCVRERERESVCVCVCVCVEREGEAVCVLIKICPATLEQTVGRSCLWAMGF